VTTNTPVFPTVTVPLTGFVTIDGAEVGMGGSIDEGGVFTFPTNPVQPEKNSAGKVKSMRRCRVFAQKGRGFGSRGQGCLINKKKSS
jgi:hypothetical protein